MRSWLWFAAGCGSLEVYDFEPADVAGEAPPSIATPTPPAADTATPFEGPGQTDASVVHLVELTTSDSGPLPVVQGLWAGDDLAVHLQIVDPPFAHGRVAPVRPDGEQDWCVPTADLDGDYVDDRLRFRLPGALFEASGLPVRAAELTGTLVDGELSTVAVALTLDWTPAKCPTCFPCEAGPCVVAIVEAATRRLDEFIVEPMSSGDAEAACD